MARLTGLFLILAGLVAMHALATTAPSGGPHRLPSHPPATAGMPSAPTMASQVAVGTGAVAGTTAPDAAPAHDTEAHLLLGCMLALAGALVTLLLRVLARGRWLHIGLPAVLGPCALRAPPVPPPRRPRILLCVLRV